MYQLTFSIEDFLANYWQKKPVILKKAFFSDDKDNGFIDPISPDELAGLAMEEVVDSRFILKDMAKNALRWQVEHGPFDEDKLSTLPENDWSLVVQAANHWHPEVAALIEPFKQMPHWLFDDVMVNFSVKNGGAGAHIDQYDVFICQGMGKRHWRVGEKDSGQYNEIIQASALRQIEHFEAIIDEQLEAGDILYIPAGFPHEGNTLEPSMSYSIGFRSPKEQELVSNFADYFLAHDMGDVHLDNPAQKHQQGFGKIQTHDAKLLADMLKRSFDDTALIDNFLGCMLSQSRHQLNIIVPEDPYTEQEVVLLLSQQNLHKVSGLKALYLEHLPASAFINGEVFSIDDNYAEIIALVCDHESLSVDDIAKFVDNQNVMALIIELINKGYWYFDQDLEE